MDFAEAMMELSNQEPKEFTGKKRPLLDAVPNKTCKTSKTSEKVAYTAVFHTCTSSQFHAIHRAVTTDSCCIC